MTFEEGEVYTNKNFPQDVMVLAIHSESDSETVMAIMWVHRKTRETTNADELVVKKSDINKWSKVVL